MKVVIVIADGAADHPQAALGGRTPLEHAFIPNMAWLTEHGTTGLVDAVFDDLPVGSIVAALGILGYDPYRHYPNGRASFEALAGGIQLGEDDVAFRCNLISTRDGVIEDFTAGLIDDATARSLVVAIHTGNPRLELFPGQSYRNILVARGARVPARSFQCFPPHQHRGDRIEDLRVRAVDDDAGPLCADLNRFQWGSIDQLRLLREELPSQADMLWLWSPSDAPRLPSFRATWGVRGAVVGGLHFLRGIGIAAKMRSPEVPGATGYLDSNLAGKVQAAIDLLEEVDVVLVHVNAADEEAHQRNLPGKLRALERIDEEVVGPLARHLRRRFPDGHRLAFLPDHYTCVEDGHHIVAPVPVTLFGTGIAPDAAMTYGEREAAARGGLGRLKAWELMPLLLGDGRSTR